MGKLGEQQERRKCPTHFLSALLLTTQSGLGSLQFPQRRWSSHKAFFRLPGWPAAPLPSSAPPLACCSVSGQGWGPQGAAGPQKAGEEGFPEQTGCRVHWQRQQAAGWRLPTAAAGNKTRGGVEPPQPKIIPSLGMERSDLLVALVSVSAPWGTTEAASKARSQRSCPACCRGQSAAAIGSKGMVCPPPGHPERRPFPGSTHVHPC